MIDLIKYTLIKPFLQGLKKYLLFFVNCCKMTDDFELDRIRDENFEKLQKVKFS